MVVLTIARNTGWSERDILDQDALETASYYEALQELRTRSKGEGWHA